MHDLIDFFSEFLIPFALMIALGVGAIAGVVVANSAWNCSAYSAVAETKMMAGTCYVKDGKQWVTHESYVNQHRISVNE